MRAGFSKRLREIEDILREKGSVNAVELVKLFGITYEWACRLLKQASLVINDTEWDDNDKVLRLKSSEG